MRKDNSWIMGLFLVLYIVAIIACAAKYDPFVG